MLHPDETTEKTTTERRRIPVRAPHFALDDVTRGWLATDPVASDVVDALSLIFPEGERFFIRSVQAYAHLYESDPEQRARVRGFVGQEGRHGHEHDRMNRSLAARGHDVAGYHRFYTTLMYRFVEPATPPHLRLASTAALEHMTATLAEVALTTDVLADAHPELARLLRWHAAEEIEHRSVAFDVLQRVDPRLRTRAIGLAIGIATLTVAWSTAFAMLRFEDRGKDPRPKDAARSRRFWRAADRSVPYVVGSVRRYLRRGFHPDHDLAPRVERAFEAAVAELAPA
ncbi:MAG: metal-dependent hydrolase [Sandaracinus sp.]